MVSYSGWDMARAEALSGVLTGPARVSTTEVSWPRAALFRCPTGREQGRYQAGELGIVEQLLVERGPAVPHERRHGEAAREETSEQVVVLGCQPVDVVAHAPGGLGGADTLGIALERDADDAEATGAPAVDAPLQRPHL